eukprot:TRINITY_DN1710_c0_g1_i1.p1 TRINITY_DN1710_c0_g1~~TRINITY_DN1710_c0_g1_i1.p1  ORF type:complete len:1111 (-),score=241.08 TRINITY_DN1710_c0_g1_i1:224-3556(-)
MREILPNSALHHLRKQATQSRQPAGKGAKAPAARSMFSDTVTTAFRLQLDVLAHTLSSCAPYFVRCIKPNSEKKPGYLLGSEIVRQLRYGGVIDAVRIMRQMYPSRKEFLDFVNSIVTNYEWTCFIARYNRGLVIKPQSIQDTLDARKDACTALCKALGLKEFDQYQIGKFKVFFRTGVVSGLQGTLKKYIDDCQATIRKYYLRWKLAKQYKLLRNANLSLQRVSRGFLARLEAKRLRREKAASLIQRNYRKMKRLGAFCSVIYQIHRKSMMEKRQKKEQERRFKAAVLVQKTFRMFRHQRRYRRFIKALIKLQAAFRGRRVRVRIHISRGERLYESKVRLQNEVAALKIENAELNSVINKRDATIEELNSKVKNLNSQLNLETKTREKLEVDLADKKAKYEHEFSEKTALQGRNELLDFKISSLQQELADTKARSEERITSLQRQIQELQRYEKELSGKIVSEQSTGEKIARSAIFIRSAVGATISNLRDHHRDIKYEMEGRVRDFMLEHKQQVEVLKQGLLTAWEHAKGLEDELDSSRLQYEELEETYGKALNELEATEKELNETKHERSVLQQEVKSLKSKVDDLNKTVSDKEKTIKELLNSVAELERSVDYRNKKIAALRQDIRSTQVQNFEASKGAFQHRGSVSETLAPASPQSPTSPSAPRPKSISMSRGVPTDRARLQSINPRQLMEQIHAVALKSGVQRTGVLLKERSVRSWAKRFLVLDGSQITYYGSAEDKTPKGVIPLESSFVSFVTERDHFSPPKENSNLECIFKITNPANERRYFFAADSPDLARSWVRDIQTNIALNTYVRKMVLVDSEPDPRVVSVFGDMNITQLTLDQKPLSLDTIVALTQPLALCSRLMTLSIRSASMDNIGIQVLTDNALSKLPRIVELYLGGNKIGADGFQKLIEGLKNNNSLRVVDISRNGLGAKSADLIGRFLREHPTVSRADFAGNFIGDAGVQAIVEVLQSDEKGRPRFFPELLLSGNNIGNVGAISISKLIEANPSIEKIVLRENYISDEGCVALAKSLQSNQSVIRLNLAQNELTDVSASALLEVIKVNKKIMIVDIGGINIEGRVLSTITTETDFIFPSLRLERRAGEIEGFDE